MNKQALKTKIISNNLFFEQVKVLLNEEKIIKIPVVGNSMNPFLRNGDIVSLKKATTGDLKPGNIVLAHFNKAYVLHRIIRQVGSKIHLAGDGNLQQMEIIGKADILGIVVKAYRGTQALHIHTFIKIWLSKIWYKLRLVRLACYKFLQANQ